MAHVKNRDMLTMTVGSFAVMIASIILNNAFLMALFGGNRDSENGGGIIIFIAAMVLTFVVYIVGTIVTMAISRYREFSADRGSAYLTRDPDALIRALRKMAFFIIPAISGESVMELFSTHPSLEKRIDNLEKVRAELKELGFVDRIGYKRNLDTYAGEYREKGKRVAYYSV